MQNLLTSAVCCADVQTPLRSVAATGPLGARPAVILEELHGSMNVLGSLRKLLRRQAELRAHLAHTGYVHHQSCGGSPQK